MVCVFDRLLSPLIRTALGSDVQVADVASLQEGPDSGVLMVTLAAPARRVVVKIQGPQADHRIDYERTRTISAMAGAAGVPTAEVLAAGDLDGERPGRYLIQEHIDGVAWGLLRPRLGPEEIGAAQRQLAEAVHAVQSVSFDSFGEIDRNGRPGGQTLLDALRTRARLRITDPGAGALFERLLVRDADYFANPQPATLSHDDLHHDNVIFRAEEGGWRLAAVLDWDKAWAGPPESDLARMSLWDDMTGPGFWAVYPDPFLRDSAASHRALIHQLLWCLEYPYRTPRHLADTARLVDLLGIG